MRAVSPYALGDALSLLAAPVRGTASDYDGLLDAIGDARFVLLGEASHGTREFYAERAAITRRLIAEKGFAAVAVEADWPDAYRVNRFVRGEGGADGREDPLTGFRRFPEWMWRNSVVLDFVLWLRQRNDALEDSGAKAGFYGLDLYSLHASADAVLRYLERADPAAARRARARYACLDRGAGEGFDYGLNAALGVTPSCEDEAVAQLTELLRARADLHASGGDAEEFFQAEQNACLVVDAVRYYRTQIRGQSASWNLRDRHMADTLEALADHLGNQAGRPAGIVVWEHNSHLGDARATEFRRHGEFNVGQLARERYGNGTYSVGFTTYSGSVRAAPDWGEPGVEMRVRPALAGSYESLFHGMGQGNFLLDLRLDHDAIRDLGDPRLERAIGVVYHPESERHSHYFEANLPGQFDAVIHIDHSHAVDTLGPAPVPSRGELPETYPSAV